MAVNEQSPDYCNGCNKQCEYGSKYYGCGVGYVPTLNKEKVVEYTNAFGKTIYVGHIGDATEAVQLAKHLAAICPKHVNNKMR